MGAKINKFVICQNAQRSKTLYRKLLKYFILFIYISIFQTTITTLYIEKKTRKA